MLDLSSIGQMISKLWLNIPGASQPTLMLLDFIATNEEEALWVSFSDGNGTGAGALFKKIEEEAASSRDIASF